MSEKRILYIFTRTPLHVGAGSSVGAIDQPIIRERHTGFPLIPGSAIKGVLADGDAYLANRKTGERTEKGRAMFGHEKPDDPNARSGSISFGEGKLLAFPVRSGKGCFAWLTCPLVIERWKRETMLDLVAIPCPNGADAYFDAETLGTPKAILEDYTFVHKGSFAAAEKLASVISDVVWRDLAAKHLMLVSDDTLAHFARTACEVAQHVRIDDESGTAADGALFNQENVPGETLFYARLNELRPAALADFAAPPVLQIGGNATSGLGYCTAQLV
jgi:CRISPR-associated protein Cmr4